MPHVIVETSQNLTLKMPAEMLGDLTQKLWESEEFDKPEDIKARLYPAPYSLVGTQAGTADSFIAVTLYLMPGRDDMVKQALAKRITDTITTHITEHEKLDTQGRLQIGVNLIELGDNYRKVII